MQSFMWMLPSEFIRWLLVLIGAVVSGQSYKIYTSGPLFCRKFSPVFQIDLGAVVCLPIWQGLKEGFGSKNLFRLGPIFPSAKFSSFSSLDHCTYQEGVACWCLWCFPMSKDVPFRQYVFKYID